MSREIAFKDIKKGDRIRFSQELLVTGLTGNGRELYTDNGVYTQTYLEGMKSLELVERPIVLPVRAGAVIKLTGGHGSGIWLLTTSGWWLSQSGAKKYMSDMGEYITAGELTHEVIV